MAKQRAPKGTATVNFPFWGYSEITRRTVVSDRRHIGTREEGTAYHNGQQWIVYRTTKTGQWFAWSPVASKRCCWCDAWADTSIRYAGAEHPACNRHAADYGEVFAWRLDTGSDGCDESLLRGRRADVIADILHHHDLPAWPNHWQLLPITKES
jgi:hypothetical protein